MLEPIGSGIWIIDGPTVSFFGMPYPTRSVLVRLRNGGIWVWSPIALTPELAAAVDELGSVSDIVSPNKIHHLFMRDWSERWPDAQLHTPPGLAKRRPELAADSELGDIPAPAWKDQIDQVVIRGSFAMEEVWFFHRESRTAIVGDLVQKFDPATLRPWHRLVMRLDGLVGPSGSTPREWRASFWNRSLARTSVRKALAWIPEQVVVAHGRWIRSNGAEILRTSLRWLRP